MEIKHYEQLDKFDIQLKSERDENDKGWKKMSFYTE